MEEHMKDAEIDGGRGLGFDQATRGDWTQMWSGARFYPADPRPDEVLIEDIAYHLGRMYRYAGAGYTVAEHSVIVSKYVPEKDALDGLLHDAPEPYGGYDIQRPVKRIIGKDNPIILLEKSIYSKAIAPRFGLSPELPESVIRMDTAILALEKKVLFPRSDPWDLPYPPPPAVINNWTAPHTIWLFLRRFCELTGYAEKPIRQRMEHWMYQDRSSINAQFGKIRSVDIDPGTGAANDPAAAEKAA
jgi:hypothetical protein